MVKRRRWSHTTWLLLGFSTVLLASALGLGAWWYWTGTVSYSLQRLYSAVKTHDRYLFEKHVDLPHVTRQAVDDMLEVELKELEKQPLSPLEQAVAPLGVAFAQLLKPRMVDEIEYALTRGIETGSLEDKGLSPEPEPGTASEHQIDDVMAEMRKDFPKLKPDKVKAVRRHGNIATVELAVRLEGGLVDGASSVPAIQVRFVRTPERFWRATEVENFKEILTFWKGIEEKRLELANRPIRKMISDSVAVVKVTKEQGLDSSGTQRDACVVVTLKNNTSAGLQGLIADVTVRDAGGELKKLQIQDVAPIPPGETREQVWPLGLNLSDNVDKLIYETDPAQLTVTVELRHIVLSDGRTIKLADSLAEVPKSSKEASPKPSTPPLPTGPVQSL